MAVHRNWRGDVVGITLRVTGRAGARDIVRGARGGCVLPSHVLTPLVPTRRVARYPRNTSCPAAMPCLCLMRTTCLVWAKTTAMALGCCVGASGLREPRLQSPRRT